MIYPIPFLIFRDKRGLDLPCFSTIRLGKAWASRVKTGQHVFLAYKHEIIGSAEVTGVQTGPLLQMLNRYATTNHVELALRQEDNDYTETFAPHRRLASMRSNYGPQKVTNDSTITVIFFERS